VTQKLLNGGQVLMCTNLSEIISMEPLILNSELW